MRQPSRGRWYDKVAGIQRAREELLRAIGDHRYEDARRHENASLHLAADLRREREC